jgi:ABC-type nitrate/sulfonate/bicarbonate transport system permease component
MAVVVLVCIVGLLAQSFVRLLETRFLRWHLRA